jgi:hypothetical protein
MSLNSIQALCFGGKNLTLKYYLNELRASKGELKILKPAISSVIYIVIRNVCAKLENI